MKIIFKLGYTEEDQLPRKSQYRTKQMIQLLEYLKSIPGEHLDKRCYRELSGGQQQRVLFPISVCMVCIDRRNTCYWISFDEYIFDRTESLWRCMQYIIWINIHPYVNTRGSFIMCGSFNHGCDIIHPAVFGKKYIRLMAGIFLMIVIFTGCGNHTISKKTSKKEIDYDLVKMDKDEVYATVYQIDGDNNKYCRLANAVIKQLLKIMEDVSSSL